MRLYFIAFLFLIMGCNSQPDKNSFVADVEEAHQKEAFLARQAIKFKLNLYFSGKSRFNGTITMLTNSTKIRMEMNNGVTLIYDGNSVYQTPDSVDYPKARFDIFTWSYFFAFPYKLSDPGTIWNDYIHSTMNGKLYQTHKLTFNKNTGDSPDDWYITYFEPDNNLMRAAAYIVTLNKTMKEAEMDPHAIEYLNYDQFNGIPFATLWKFWEWREGEGFIREIGKGYLSDIEFIETNDEFFKKPERYKLIQ